MNLICLDLDGTLEDSRQDMVAAVQRVRAQLSLPARQDAVILPWVNKGMDQLYRACFDDYFQEVPMQYDDVRLRYEADYYDHVAVNTTLYPGIAEAVEQLSELGTLAVVTNKPERISRHLLETLGIGKYFSTVIGCDTCETMKPDPKVLEEAVRRCDVPAAGLHVCMIGDTAADLKMGRAFGAATIWCAWGYMSEPGERADAMAKTPDSLPALVRDTWALSKAI